MSQSAQPPILQCPGCTSPRRQACADADGAHIRFRAALHGGSREQHASDRCNGEGCDDHAAGQDLLAGGTNAVECRGVLPLGCSGDLVSVRIVGRSTPVIGRGFHQPDTRITVVLIKPGCPDPEVLDQASAAAAFRYERSRASGAANVTNQARDEHMLRHPPCFRYRQCSFAGTPALTRAYV